MATPSHAVVTAVEHRLKTLDNYLDSEEEQAAELEDRARVLRERLESERAEANELRAWLDEAKADPPSVDPPSS